MCLRIRKFHSGTCISLGQAGVEDIYCVLFGAICKCQWRLVPLSQLGRSVPLFFFFDELITLVLSICRPLSGLLDKMGCTSENLGLVNQDQAVTVACMGRCSTICCPPGKRANNAAGPTMLPGSKLGH